MIASEQVCAIRHLWQSCRPGLGGKPWLDLSATTGLPGHLPGPSPSAGAGSTPRPSPSSRPGLHNRAAEKKAKLQPTTEGTAQGRFWTWHWGRQHVVPGQRTDQLDCLNTSTRSNAPVSARRIWERTGQGCVVGSWQAPASGAPAWRPCCPRTCCQHRCCLLLRAAHGIGRL